MLNRRVQFIRRRCDEVLTFAADAPRGPEAPNICATFADDLAFLGQYSVKLDAEAHFAVNRRDGSDASVPVLAPLGGVSPIDPIHTFSHVPFQTFRHPISLSHLLRPDPHTTYLPTTFLLLTRLLSASPDVYTLSYV